MLENLCKGARIGQDVQSRRTLSPDGECEPLADYGTRWHPQGDGVLVPIATN